MRPDAVKMSAERMLAITIACGRLDLALSEADASAVRALVDDYADAVDLTARWADIRSEGAPLEVARRYASAAMRAIAAGCPWEGAAALLYALAAAHAWVAER